MAVTYSATYKNRKTKKSQQNFRFQAESFQKSCVFVQSIHEKKIMSKIQKKMEENAKKPAKSKKKPVDFLISAKFFNLFVKVTVTSDLNVTSFSAVSQGKKMETKIWKKTFPEGFSVNRQKNIQKVGISGGKRYCPKGVSGIYESVKNSVLKAISDETRLFD